jgi:DNA helicase-2/ATP-dependent DNA helicase PcrA
LYAYTVCGFAARAPRAAGVRFVRTIDGLAVSLISCVAQPEHSAPGAPYLEKLNDAQRAAVEHGVGDRAGPGGPLLVIAGAGSGKTNTLAHRVAHLLVNGVDPRRVLLLTFSRRAAQDMTRRATRIAAQALGTRADLAQALEWTGTFHGVGARLLREYAELIGLSPVFTIHDREDCADLLNVVRHELGLSAKARRFPVKGTCLAIYSRVVNTGATLSDVLEHAFPWCREWEADLRALFAGYVAAKQAQNVLDYDDLLLYWARMAAEPSIAADLGARFDHVLVDEYQDTNRLQATILLAMKPDGHGLTVVGDDAQSIYSFRGATVRNILDFPGHFTPGAARVTLERNYRSTAPILAASNAVIGLATERFTKDLWTDKASAQRPRLVSVAGELEQARYVVEAVLEAREAGMKLKAQAVLFRAAHHSAALELELARRNIPFVKFGGLRFLDSVHVKDVLAVLRWAQNPRDRVAGFRVLQLMPGIGPATAGRVLDAVAGAGALQAALGAYEPPARAAADWGAFAGLMSEVGASRTPWPAEFEQVRRWYEPHLERNHEDAPTRHADILQMESLAATFPTRERFLTELTLDPPDATSDESGVPLVDEDYLILSTIHSSKGQEWRNVFVLNGVDGCIPSDLGTGSQEEIDEERRLLYVAMTRAKEDLHIVVPQRFYVHNQNALGDRHVWASRTRFIPEPLLGLFDVQAWPRAANTAPPTATGLAAAAKARVDIAAQLKAMWD